MTLPYAKSPVFALTAVARDPRTAFVCWDRQAFGSDKLNGKVGANVRAIVGWCLRVASVDGLFCRDCVIAPEAGNYYLTGLRGGVDYRVSILAQDTVREKHQLAACGPFALPADAVSDEEMAGWEISKDLLRELCGGEIAASAPPGWEGDDSEG